MMETPAEICENYQLKWSSYTTYIHSCIASSLISEDSFADVALVTMDGHKIMAHRFVLSYSSQYLNKALKFQPKVTTALPVMIVLPQGITYKALKILVKYMYSGEATVPKDILNTVLKAGDLLKIKGLYREPLEEDPNKLLKTSKNTQLPVPESQTQKARDPKLPENSPIISKNPPPLVAASSVTQKIIQSQNEATKAKEAQKVKMLQTKVQNKLPEKVVSASNTSVKQYAGPRVLNFTMNNFNGMEKENASPKRAIILNQKVSQQDKPHTITSADAESHNSSDSTTLTIKAENGKTDNLSYLVIKDEPVEWTESELEIVDEKDVFEGIEESVKTEHYDSTSNEGKGKQDKTAILKKLTFVDLESVNIGGNISNYALLFEGFRNDGCQNIDKESVLNVPALILKDTACQATDTEHEMNTIQDPPPSDTDIISIPDSASNQPATDQELLAFEVDTDTRTVLDVSEEIDDTKTGSFDDATNDYILELPFGDDSENTTAVSELTKEDDPLKTSGLRRSINTLWPIFDDTSRPLNVMVVTTCRSSDGYDSESESSRPVLEMSALKDFDAIGFINQDQIGKAILQRAYRELLTSSDRDRLADLIITHFLNKLGHLSLKQLKILAKKMEEIPNEKSVTYFVPPVSKKHSSKGKSEPARGKFMDKVRNRLSFIRQTLGVVKGKKQLDEQGTSKDDIQLSREVDSDSLMEPPTKQMKFGKDILSNYSLDDNTTFSDSTDPEWPLKGFNFVSFINHDLLGQALYRKAHKGMLNNGDRDRLADLVLTHFLNRFNGQLEMKILKRLALLFEKYIPHEKSMTYYVDPVNKGKSIKRKSEPARGKLVDKYRNTRQLIRTLMQEKQKIAVQNQKSAQLEAEELYIPSKISDEAKQSQTWLKSNNEPENEVTRYWKNSFVIRRSTNSDITTLLDEWPIMKTSFASFLISSDFDRILKRKDNFNFEAEFNALFIQVCNGRLSSISPLDRRVYGFLQDDDLSAGSNTEIYTPLTCELCTETFTIPADWVKHVQTHTDMLPAKRRRRDSPDEEDENASYPELQCDMCDKSFPTPAEWVRHIQDTHTEFELSLSNRKNETKKLTGVKKYKLVMKN